MTKMEISSQMTYHSVMKVSGVTSKSSQIATFLVVTNGNKHSIRFSQFLTLFALGAGDRDYPKLHNGGLLEHESLYFMYPRDHRANVGHVRGLYTYYSVRIRLLRATIAPRDGNPSDISRFKKNLMIALSPGADPFSGGIIFGRRSSFYQKTRRRSAATAHISCL
jgi:hypothetical protein